MTKRVVVTGAVGIAPTPAKPLRLTRRALLDAAEHLAERDPDLQRILRTHGPPPLWVRQPGFETLVRIILEQQVLLMALRRPDVWPAGDIALQRAVHRVKGLRRQRPAEGIARLAETWRPFRSVAARMIWQQYLAERR